MKHNRYTKFFGWFAAATLLLTTSCKDDLFDGNGGNLSDEVTVSFTLAPEGVSATGASARRASGEEGENGGHVDYTASHISDGSKADVLIYAVYDENGNLLEQYGGHTDDQLQDVYGIRAGQTIKHVPRNGNEGGFPVKINLTLKRGATYKIAFWAQSSKTKAYNTEDLKRVEVIYSEIAKETSEDGTVDDGGTTTPNNDEFRDAFCRVVPITAGEDGSVAQDVYLYRPLAQINVGTSGYDYEVAMRKTEKKYTYSKIRVNRAARYLDVVKDEVYASTTRDNNQYVTDEDENEETLEAFQVVDFGYAPIPAYVNMTTPPTYPSYTIWDWDYNKGEFKHSEDVQRDTYNDEEFLKVHLYDKENNNTDYVPDDENGYAGYANLDNYDGKLSETFKYLSMCYVLTNSTKNKRTTLNNVKVWLATDADGANEIQILDINYVPAQRNWRTNIVGDLLTTTQTYQIKLDTDFAGEYNGIYSTNEWTGYLADGVYYDGDADEIQISNANGLIWFQKMVNGTMKIREAIESTGSLVDNTGEVTSKWSDKVGGYYYFYTSNSSTARQLKYEGISQPSDQTQLDRILVATHQKWNQNTQGWPTNGNFHFTGNKDGKDYPAKVKLMADIDLSGIEWIPIGFDGRILETVAIPFDDYNADNKYNYASNRGFYGIFDGNNHTISGLYTKRFSAEVPDWNRERTKTAHTDKGSQYTASYKYVDNFQWFGRGLFGEIGGNAEIKNVRLRNVDIIGCQGVGGIVGMAYGNAIKITNCIVDGGKLVVTPMYRGDMTGASETTTSNDEPKTTTNYNKAKDRTFARGVYLGGIVGYFNTVGGVVENCEVKNLYMCGYRRVGGLIGSVDLNKADGKGGTGELNIDDSAGTSLSNSTPASISNNRISNTTLIASQFSTFGMDAEIISDTDVRSGFGWSESQYDLYAQQFVGGDSKDYVDKYPSKCSGNSASGLTFSEFKIWQDTSSDPQKRIATMREAPLEYMPMLSSWYTDEITLYANYFGKHSAYRLHHYNDQNKFNVFSSLSPRERGSLKSSSKQTVFYFPMKLPREVDIDWVTTSPKVGLYVESVILDGSKGPNRRSVLTPNDVDGQGACAMYITARDRNQFKHSSGLNGADYKKPTTVQHMVVRGKPYAHTGILIAPNKNMDKVTLKNVAIYDVYQTIALDDLNGLTSTATFWPRQQYDNENPLELEVQDCNLRGYTVPGSKWTSVKYIGTTFERGSSTTATEAVNNRRLERTCKVEAPTSFSGCYFKAPYIIDLSAGATVTFDDKCYATATSTNNKKIVLPSGCTRIVISEDAGNPVVTYYNGITVIQ